MSFIKKKDICEKDGFHFAGHYATLFPKNILRDCRSIAIPKKVVIHCANFTAEEPFLAVYFYFKEHKMIGEKPKGGEYLAPLLPLYDESGVNCAHTPLGVMYAQTKLPAADENVAYRQIMRWREELVKNGDTTTNCWCGKQLSLFDEDHWTGQDKKCCADLGRPCIYFFGSAYLDEGNSTCLRCECCTGFGKYRLNMPLIPPNPQSWD